MPVLAGASGVGRFGAGRGGGSTDPTDPCRSAPARQAPGPRIPCQKDPPAGVVVVNHEFLQTAVENSAVHSSKGPVQLAGGHRLPHESTSLTPTQPPYRLNPHAASRHAASKSPAVSCVSGR